MKHFLKQTALWMACMVTFVLTSCDSDKNTDENPEETMEEVAKNQVIFQNKYYQVNVFDCNRSPADPVAGETWRLHSFIAPYDSQTEEAIVWPERGYLMFDIEEDIDKKFQTSLIDDVQNSDKTYKIQLKLYDASGTLVKLVSDYGKFGGFGDAGFFYEQEGHYGTLFTNTGFSLGDELTYKPTTAYITKLSELFNYTYKPEDSAK